MPTLTNDKPREYEVDVPAYFNEIPVIANDIIYQGAAVGESSSTGTARPLVAGDVFLGFATARVDNTGGSAAAKSVHVRAQGVIRLPITNVDNINDVGDTVFASDDDTFTLASTGNTAIGRLIRYDAATATGWVFFQSAHVRSI